jgi:hypothetical protein
MRRKTLALAVVLLTLAAALVIRAQDVEVPPIEPLPGAVVDPAINISWPPPVYALSGSVQIRGSANLPNMTSYFVEFRELTLEPANEGGAPTATPDPNAEEEPWFIAILPGADPVIDDVLGVWNTQTTADGLYELRLVVNVANQTPQFFRVSPVRVLNQPPDFLVELDATQVVPTPTPAAGRPTLAATPTAFDTTPRVTANVNANVRSGDSTGYEIIAVLQVGQTARVLGLSTTGNGWYYIELVDGSRGWIAPSTVTAAGDIRSVPRVNPPATPTPPATNTPPPQGNLTGSPPSISPNPPTCNVSFSVLVNITNTGSARTASPVAVIIRDVHVATGTVQTSVTREVPQLDPGQNWVVGADFTVSTFFNEEHRIEVLIDPSNQAPETNESDNTLSSNYILQTGACP